MREQHAADRLGSERDERPCPVVPERARRHEQRCPHEEQDRRLRGQEHPHAAAHRDDARPVGPGLAQLARDEHDQAGRQGHVADEPDPADDARVVELRPVQEDGEQQRAVERERDRDHHPRARPLVVAQRDDQQRQPGPVAGPEQGGGHRDVDRPRPPAVGVLGEDERREPQRDDQHPDRDVDRAELGNQAADRGRRGAGRGQRAGHGQP
jgi:hypothetical protein